MIFVTKEEAIKIRNVYKDAPIYKTMKKKHGKRGKRYCPEEDKYMKIIQESNENAKHVLKYGR